jgi:hypothetical protein
MSELCDMTTDQCVTVFPPPPRGTRRWISRMVVPRLTSRTVCLDVDAIEQAGTRCVGSLCVGTPVGGREAPRHRLRRPCETSVN